MTLDEQIKEVTTDINEVKRLIDSTDRPRIKQNLELQRQKFEKELSQLEEKQKKAKVEEEQQKATTTTTPSRIQSKDITVYAWDQSDKFVKIYVQNLDGIDKLPQDQVQCTFEKRGFQLQIQNFKNTNYSLKRVGLLNDIDPDQSTFKVKKDMIILSLRKTESTHWECLLKDEKKTPMKPIPNIDPSGGSNEKFMNMVEEMYENGDDDMKRAIAKAWTQSREKASALTPEQREQMTNPGILRTSDFTIYPPPRKTS